MTNTRVTDEMVEAALNVYNAAKDIPLVCWPVDDQRYMRAALEAALAMEAKTVMLRSDMSPGHILWEGCGGGDAGVPTDDPRTIRP